jgi:hypothetical protein
MNIFFVGLSGVPYTKRACDTRLLSFANIFVQNQHKVTILNRLPICNQVQKGNNQLPTNIKIVELFNCSKPKSLFINILYWLSSYPKEFIQIYELNKKSKIDILHLYSGHYFEFFHYYLISKIIDAKIIYQYVEVRSSINKKGIYHKINGYLCDKYGYKLFDGVISISNYIDKMVNNLSSDLPRIKVPPICDVNYYDNIKVTTVSEPYIMFCGSAEYCETINLIISSYKLSNAVGVFKLILVLSGSDDEMKEILIPENYNISVFSGLFYNELVKLYLGASALLIPLRNTIEDNARFPNKICEYTACKGVIITNNVGEIPFYFTDGKNALIANDFSREAIIGKLNFLVGMNSEDISRIKVESYELCKLFFESSVYSTDLDMFLKKVKES